MNILSTYPHKVPVLLRGAGGSSGVTPAGPEAPERLSEELRGCPHLCSRLEPPVWCWGSSGISAALAGAWTASAFPLPPAMPWRGEKKKSWPKVTINATVWFGVFSRQVEDSCINESWKSNKPVIIVWPLLQLPCNYLDINVRVRRSLKRHPIVEICPKKCTFLDFKPGNT